MDFQLHGGGGGVVTPNPYAVQGPTVLFAEKQRSISPTQKRIHKTELSFKSGGTVTSPVFSNIINF